MCAPPTSTYMDTNRQAYTQTQTHRMRQRDDTHTRTHAHTHTRTHAHTRTHTRMRMISSGFLPSTGIPLTSLNSSPTWIRPETHTHQTTERERHVHTMTNDHNLCTSRNIFGLQSS